MATTTIIDTPGIQHRPSASTADPAEAISMNTPTQMLDAAEQEFRNHRFLDGANLVWDATCQSITTAARRFNLPCNAEQDIYSIAAKLDHEQDVNRSEHWICLSVADAYRTQAAHYGGDGDWEWDADEYVENLDGIRAGLAYLSQHDNAAKQQDDTQLQPAKNSKEQNTNG